MLSFALCALTGLAVGVLSGMLGIGGGMIMLPVFRLGFGMAALQATATSLFTIIPTSIAGCVKHLRNRTCLPAVGIAAGIGGACSSPVGVYLASISPSWTVMVAAALVIGYSAVSMFRKALAMPKRPGDACSEAAAGRQDAGPGREEGRPQGRKALALAAATGLVAGIASGYIGVGGGFVMMPLFVSLLGLSMKKASGTSLIAVSILAVPGVAEQLLLGNVLVGAGIAMAVGSIPGAVIGADLAKRVPERQLRFLFGGLLLVAAASLALKELGI